MSYNDYNYELERVVGLTIKENSIILTELCDEYFWFQLDNLTNEEMLAITTAFEILVKKYKEQDCSPY